VPHFAKLCLQNAASFAGNRPRQALLAVRRSKESGLLETPHSISGFFSAFLGAEGMGFEPTTHCWASDFESDRWPIRLPSELLAPNVGRSVGALKFSGIFPTVSGKRIDRGRRGRVGLQRF
jgi:hypothetical protein